MLRGDRKTLVVLTVTVLLCVYAHTLVRARLIIEKRKFVGNPNEHRVLKPGRDENI